MKKIVSILIVAVMVLGLAACGTEQPETPVDTTNGAGQQTETSGSAGSTAAEDGEIKSLGPNGETAVSAETLGLTDEEIEQIKAGNYKAAISFHYGGNDWSASQLQGLKDTFEKLGIEVVGVTDANFAPERQVSDLETLMALKPDIMVSIPTDPTATADAFQRVADAGVKLVFMDNVPNGFEAGKNYVSAVSADNYGNGIIAADLIGEALGGKGRIGVVYFDVDFFVTNQRLEAFDRTMAEKYPDIEIVSRMPFQDTNEASNVADAMITQNPTIDAIFAHWDVPAEGVLSSLRAAGMNDVKISTIDLGNNIAKEIAAGSVLGVGAQLPYDQGVAEATLAAYALLGKEAPPYVAVPAKRVDQSNILEAYEDVYKVSAPSWLVEAKN
ncbi:substrate-binding domain-containing protein [Anaerotalea alkaliphila]|uniref:Substrate-binding domain-containing protein n=1 Tax=Anaerotalea alkaliphila TaxID=2662126 RepID=A0A7X5HUP3_9FIRM|nr:substrate-binding domain-containing protein [Anaerotalea alkaliphila]NDL67025.1 substrate-binding domain-containing protein [Anaerotalea alkaliphila]